MVTIYDRLTNTAIEADINTVCKNLTMLRDEAVRTLYTDDCCISVRDYTDAIGVKTDASVEFFDLYGWSFENAVSVEFNFYPTIIEDGTPIYVLSPSIDPTFILVEVI